jgi:hypothetical protein
MGVPKSAPAVIVDFDGGLMDGGEEEYEDGDNGGRGTEMTETKRLLPPILSSISPPDSAIPLSSMNDDDGHESLRGRYQSPTQ